MRRCWKRTSRWPIPRSTSSGRPSSGWAYAAEVEGQGRSADDLAFLRDAWDFRNVLLVELPNGDFGQTMMRQFLFDAWGKVILARLRARPTRAYARDRREGRQGKRLSRRTLGGTVVGLGDGTEESHARMQAALDALYPYVGELFESDDTDAAMAEAGIAPDPASLRPAFDAWWPVMAKATLRRAGGRVRAPRRAHGRMHTEHLGHILCSMQWLQRAYPGCTW